MNDENNAGMMFADDILRRGVQILAERGKARDKAETKERSMARIVRTFNALTGYELTEADGWFFMVCLKAARHYNNPGKVDPDDFVDGANYFALAGESLLRDKDGDA